MPPRKPATSKRPARIRPDATASTAPQRQAAVNTVTQVSPIEAVLAELRRLSEGQEQLRQENRALAAQVQHMAGQQGTAGPTAPATTSALQSTAAPPPGPVAQLPTPQCGGSAGLVEQITGINVLTCTWKQDEKFECKTAPEYTLDKNITETLTLRIPNATKAVVGTYKCQVVPPDGTIPHVCNFLDFGANTTQPTNECKETANTTQPTDKCRETDDYPSPCVFWVVPTLIALASIALNVYQFFSGRSKTKTNAANNQETRPLLEVVVAQPLTPQKNFSTFDEVESRAIFELSASEVLIDTARHR